MKLGAPLEIAHVLVRDVQKARVSECPPELMTTDPERVFGDASLDVVVEVMGGLEPARAYIERAIARGLTVVTANKLLLATDGPRLLREAVQARVDVAFEAAVGGGIPVIRTVHEHLAGDRVESMIGILNGTCNYILTRMRTAGLSFEAALGEAQQLGYAEADPTLDVGGFDAAQKLIILSMLAFSSSFAADACPTEGITAVDKIDFASADRFGYTIKHLVIGEEKGGAVALRAHPALVPRTSVLANIDGSLNCVLLRTAGLGPCVLVGRGAGDLPTAVSVVADLVAASRARIEGQEGLATRAIHTKERALVPLSEHQGRFYLRFEVQDAPGVLAKIAGALGEHGVSVHQMVQDGADDSARLFIFTHETREGDLTEALQKLSRADFLRAPARFIRIEDV